MDETPRTEIAVPGPGKYRGRPKGAKNYGGISMIAREFKAQGVDWRTALVRAYKALEAAHTGTPEYDKAREQVAFWREALPYLLVKMEHKLGTRGPRPYTPHRTSLKAAIKTLEQMESR